MAAQGAAHDRLRDLLDEPSAADRRAAAGPSLRMAAIGAVVCLLLLVLVLAL